MGMSVISAEDFIAVDPLQPILNSVVVPRPIAFVTSKGKNGVVNAAPFSYFNILCSNPCMVSIAIERREGGRKDTARNIIAIGEFVINICSLKLAGAVSLAGGDYPPEISEIEKAKLSLLDSLKVSVPRIANAPVQIECLLHQIVEVGVEQCDLILAKVIKIHVRKDILNEVGEVDPGKLDPLARIAGPTYAKVTHFFDIERGDK